MEKKFDIPGFTYFSEKNTYTGSIGNIFNYKITPGEQLEVIVWSGKFCLDKTPEENIIATQSFDLTREALEELKNWLDEKHQETLK